MRHVITTAATVAVLALAGCGGDDEETGQGGGQEPAATTQAEPAATEEQQASAGRETFSGTCGGCHTLSAAGTNGQVGPNLDELKPDEDRVLNAIKTGPSQMPENLLQGAEAREVAKYVAENAGG